MKICYLNHDLRNNTGAGKFCWSFIQAVKAILPNCEIKILTSEDVLAGGSIFLFFNFFKIRYIFKKYDIIHALDGWPYGVIAALFTLGLKKKMVITAIGTGAVQPLYKIFKKIIMIWAYRRADIVVAVSHNTKREILKIIPNLSIEVINHGVDFDKFQIPCSNITEIEKIKPYLISVGSLKKRKGFEYSIRAFAQIIKNNPSLKYVIVGDGPEKENLILLVADLRLQDNIIFLKNVDEKHLV